MKLSYLSTIAAVAVIFTALSCDKIAPVEPQSEPEQKEEEKEPDEPEVPPSPPVLSDYEEEVVEATLEELCAKRMPVIFITLDGNAVINDATKDIYREGTISFRDPDGRYTSTKYSECRMKMKGRGNSTWNHHPKKPYRIKLDKKMRVLGMPVEKDWDLLANHSDKSLLRNKVAMELSRRLGMPWTPRHRTCEVYLNGEYIGVYDIFEHKEVGKAKVDINPSKEGETDPQKIQGDYYLEVDSRHDGVYFDTRYLPIVFKDPEAPSQEQIDYLTTYFRLTESAIDVGRNYETYIDVPSFIDYFIIEELAKDIDGDFRLSSFFVKKLGGKLSIAHMWDFDICFGNANFFDASVGNGPTGWFVRNWCWKGKNKGWYYQLFTKSDDFAAKVKARWKEVYPLLESIPDYIDQERKLIEPYAAKNFQRWDVLGTAIWPNVTPVPADYDGEIQYLKKFYTERLRWMDTQISIWPDLK